VFAIGPAAPIRLKRSNNTQIQAQFKNTGHVHGRPGRLGTKVARETDVLTLLLPPVVPVKENDRAITGLVMLGHALVHTYELSLPLLILVWAEVFPAVTIPGVGAFQTTPFVLGAVLTVGYAPFGLGAVPGGVLADRFGSQRLIVACLAGMGLSFAMVAVAPTLLTVAIALLGWGLAASVYHPSGLALISKGADARGAVFAYHGMAGNVGIAVGPLLTAVLLFLTGDWRLVAAGLAGPALLGAVLATRMELDEGARATPADGGRTETALTGGFVADSKRLFGSLFALAFVLSMFSGVYYRGVLTFLPDLLSTFEQLEPISVSGAPRSLQPDQYVYSGLLMVGVLGQYVGGRLTDKLTVTLPLAAGYGVLSVIALLFLPVATHSLAGLAVAGALLGFFLFMIQPLYQATIAEYTPSSLRGLSYGYTYTSVFGVGALGGTLAGATLTYGTQRLLFLLLAGFAAGAMGLAAVLFRRGQAAA